MQDGGVNDGRLSEEMKVRTAKDSDVWQGRGRQRERGQADRRVAGVAGLRCLSWSGGDEDGVDDERGIDNERATPPPILVHRRGLYDLQLGTER